MKSLALFPHASILQTKTFFVSPGVENVQKATG
jgi:hypothetical protein